eukprot:scaffold510_cov242-Pinguiococcus_pyrenoidosus.AAC.13
MELSMFLTKMLRLWIRGEARGAIGATAARKEKRSQTRISMLRVAAEGLRRRAGPAAAFA